MNYKDNTVDFDFTSFTESEQHEDKFKTCCNIWANVEHVLCLAEEEHSFVVAKRLQMWKIGVKSILLSS